MNDIILEVQDLHKAYREGAGELRILTGVNLTLKRGEIACVMGESGSGKTTLLNLLGSLDRPDRGSIIYNGQDITRLRGKALAAFRNRHIGFLFQFHYLLSDFTALENVIMPCLIAGEKAAAAAPRAGDLMARVGLAERTGHYPAELSGGEQQRAAMLRAVINGPMLVLADEPTGNLDEKNSGRLLDAIFEVGRAIKQTFLIATHSRKLAGRCDTVFVLENGKAEKTHEL
jgi:lipoprotein-releasing system ATP-binding protein